MRSPIWKWVLVWAFNNCNYSFKKHFIFLCTVFYNLIKKKHKDGKGNHCDYVFFFCRLSWDEMRFNLVAATGVEKDSGEYDRRKNKKIARERVADLLCAGWHTAAKAISKQKHTHTCLLVRNAATTKTTKQIEYIIKLKDCAENETDRSDRNGPEMFFVCFLFIFFPKARRWTPFTKTTTKSITVSLLYVDYACE